MQCYMYYYVYISIFIANVENSNLYLKLFKLVFGSVSLFAQENEQMLKVHYFNRTTFTLPRFLD